LPQLESKLEPSGLVVSATAWYSKRQIAQLKQTQLIQLQGEHKHTRSLWSEKKEKKKNSSGLNLFRRRSPLCLSLQIFSFLM